MKSEKIPQKISGYGLTMIVIGSCIGSGIFLSPQYAASYFNDPLHLFIAWIIGGFITTTGALTYGELAAMFPRAGGIYVFLKEAFGKRTAFLYGWCVLTAITTGAIAALALAFADNLPIFLEVEFSPNTKLGIAIAVILFNTIIHVLGIKIGEIFINIFSGLKILGILAVIGIGFYFFGEFSETNFQVIPTVEEDNSLLVAFGLALIPIMWSFSGFQHASFLSGEAKNPTRTVPRAMFIGTAIVAVVYLLCNISYVNLLGLESLAGSTQPAVDAMDSVIDNGGKWMALLISISVFGSAFIFTMSAPRIYFAMAKDGVFFKWLAVKNKRFNTPANAIITQSVWSLFLVIYFGTFKDLINYATFVEFIFLLLAAIGLFILRKKMKDVHRPVKTPLYPFLTILFCLIVLYFLIVVISQDNANAIVGLVVLVAGIIFYEVYSRIIS